MAAISTGPDESLAKLWESDIRIRERLRYNHGRLLVWPQNKEGKEQIGVASMAAISMNCNILSTLAGWWCPTQKVPKTPCIAIIKSQVWVGQKCSGLPTSFDSIYRNPGNPSVDQNVLNLGFVLC